MGNDDEEPVPQGNVGAMVGHIERYKQYISDLKKGQSSGISSAFGRASDLLPSEVMQIEPPRTKPELTTPELGDRVWNADFASDELRRSLESLIVACADDLEEPIGVTVDTPYGELTVEEVYLEGGARRFLLNDLRVIDEQEFQRWRRPPVDAGNDHDVHASADIAAPTETAAPAEIVAPLPLVLPLAPVKPISGLPAAANSSLPDLLVTTPAGSFLWSIYFDGFDPQLIEMFDGSVIRQAEGRDEYVMALNSADGNGMKMFILSGLMVDPSTGNIFVEANEGTYTAGFLNNGWRIHQYRTHDQKDRYYVTEPSQVGKAPATLQVENLNLDVETGEVTYETADSAALVTLRSRTLFNDQ